MTDTPRVTADDIPTSVTRLVYSAPKIQSYRPSGELSQNQAAEFLAHFWPEIERHIRDRVLTEAAGLIAARRAEESAHERDHSDFADEYERGLETDAIDRAAGWILAARSTTTQEQ